MKLKIKIYGEVRVLQFAKRGDNIIMLENNGSPQFFDTLFIGVNKGAGWLNASKSNKKIVDCLEDMGLVSYFSPQNPYCMFPKYNINAFLPCCIRTHQ